MNPLNSYFDRPPKLVLLDRDGVINVDRRRYVTDPRDWQPFPEAANAIRTLNLAGCHVGVCTNQAGIGKGLFTHEMLHAVHEEMQRHLSEHGARIDAIQACPHGPDHGCECRKPAPGMLLELMAQFDALPSETCFLGDNQSDLRAAKAAGCLGIEILTGHTESRSDYAREHNFPTFPRLEDAASWLTTGIV